MSAFGVLLGSLLDNPDLGVDVVYTPQAGSAVTCRGAWAQEDVTAQMGAARMRDQKRLLIVKQADIAQPAKTAMVTIGNSSFRVVDFEAVDPQRLTWTLTLALDS